MNSDFMQAVWQEIRTHLENVKRGIYAEITTYPPPIPACDVQFNYLLEQRSKVALELRQLDAALDKPFSSIELAEWIDEFVRESSFIDDDMEQEIQSELRQQISEA